MNPLSKHFLHGHFLIGMALLLPLMVSCQEGALPDGEGEDVKRLTQIPDDPGYTSLELIGTQWQLIGFVNGSRIRLPQAPGGYTLTFHDGGVVSGRTAANLTHGRYTLTNKQLLVSDFRDITEAARFPDDGPFIASMNSVFSYEISPKGLALYYDRQKYLLFRPGSPLI
jgi:hypothetical protein